VRQVAGCQELVRQVVGCQELVRQVEVCQELLRQVTVCCCIRCSRFLNHKFWVRSRNHCSKSLFLWTFERVFSVTICIQQGIGNNVCESCKGEVSYSGSGHVIAIGISGSEIWNTECGMYWPHVQRSYYASRTEYTLRSENFRFILNIFWKFFDFICEWTSLL
jgi:hypothetical protein